MDILVLHTELQKNLTGLKLDSYAEQLNDHYRSKFDRYIKLQSKLNFITGRLLLLKGLNLMEKKSIDFNVLNQIKLDNTEKPHLENTYFNISHSENHVIVALSKKIEIGVDIEKLKYVRIDAFKNLFSEHEFQIIKEDKSNSTFYEFWTKKEAALKTIGSQLRDMTKIEVSKSNQIQFGTQTLIAYEIPIFNKQVIAHLCHKVTDASISLIYKLIEPDELFKFNA